MTATAAQTPIPRQGSAIKAPPTPPECLPDSFREFADAVWDADLWKRGAPDGRTIAAERQKLGCAPTDRHREAMKATWHRDRAAFYLEVRFRHVAIYSGYTHAGHYLRFMAVPRWIVDCETNGVYGDAKWDTINSAGAGGPAQLLGHGQPQPADTPRERVEYWEIAAALLAEEGTSPWEQCGG